MSRCDVVPRGHLQSHTNPKSLVGILLGRCGLQSPNLEVTAFGAYDCYLWLRLVGKITSLEYCECGVARTWEAVDGSAGVDLGIWERLYNKAAAYVERRKLEIMPNTARGSSESAPAY
jgi:hypothetical protein